MSLSFLNFGTARRFLEKYAPAAAPLSYIDTNFISICRALQGLNGTGAIVQTTIQYKIQMGSIHKGATAK